MQYRSPPQSGPDVLREDRRRMHEMTQPDLVKQQLSELFCSLSREVGQALDVGDLHTQQFPQVMDSSDYALEAEQTSSMPAYQLPSKANAEDSSSDSEERPFKAPAVKPLPPALCHTRNLPHTSSETPSMDDSKTLDMPSGATESAILEALSPKVELMTDQQGPGVSKDPTETSLDKSQEVSQMDTSESSKPLVHRPEVRRSGSVCSDDRMSLESCSSDSGQRLGGDAHSIYTDSGCVTTASGHFSETTLPDSLCTTSEADSQIAWSMGSKSHEQRRSKEPKDQQSKSDSAKSGNMEQSLIMDTLFMEASEEIPEDVSV